MSVSCIIVVASLVDSKVPVAVDPTSEASEVSVMIGCSVGVESSVLKAAEVFSVASLVTEESVSVSCDIVVASLVNSKVPVAVDPFSVASVVVSVSTVVSYGVKVVSLPSLVIDGSVGVILE